jgi:phospholipid/cholesterol/gamma-HCH transport system substrate-binding protein
VRSKLAPAVVGRLIVAVLCTALVVAFLQRPGPKKMIVQADFQRAGLNVRPGDEVRVRGMPVGTISAITIDRSNLTARYKMSLEPNAQVAKDSGATLVPKTLFGDKYVELDPPAPGAPLMGNGAHIPLARTASVTELQQVLDRFIPELQAVDPVELGATVAAMANGFGLTAADLRAASEGFTGAFNQFSASQSDFATIFQHFPGVADTFTQHTGDLVSSARNFSQLADVLSKNEPALARSLSADTDLLNRANELLTSEGDRMSRITRNGLDVLAIVDQYPGKFGEFLAAVPVYLNGVERATRTGVFRAIQANVIVLFPTFDAKGNLGHGQSGPGEGANVVINHPSGPASQPIDVSPSGGITGTVGGAVNGAGGGLGSVFGAVAAPPQVGP